MNDLDVLSEPAFVAVGPGLLARAKLLGNVPNPFNPQTEIRFELSQPGEVALSIFDADLAEATAGMGSWVWNGRDDQGKFVASGVYYVKLQSGRSTDVRPVTLVR